MRTMKIKTVFGLLLSLLAFLNISSDLFAGSNSQSDNNAIAVVRNILCSKKHYEGDKRLYTLEDLKAGNGEGKSTYFKDSKSQESILYVKALRNEIFARHGREFKSPDLKDIFDNCGWYKPSKNYSDEMLNEFEKRNVEFLSNFEKERNEKKTAETRTSESGMLSTRTLKANGEKTVVDKNEPLTEEEIKKVNAKFKIPGEIFESEFESNKETAEYLSILLKGNHKAFHINTPHTPDEQEGEEQIGRFQYSDTIRTLLSFLSPKDAFPFAIEILKTKPNYPEAVAKAAEVLNFSKDKSVIPLLKQTARHPNSGVRYWAARSLLALGDGDTALPILEDMAIKEGYSAALYALFSGPGKIIDGRGFKIVEKGLINPQAEVRIHSAKLLFEAKKMGKEKLEETAVKTLSIFKSEVEYGITHDPKRGIIPIPGYENIFEKSQQQIGRDWRAIETAISLLTELKSKKGIPALERLANNPQGSYLSRNALGALKVLKQQQEVK